MTEEAPTGTFAQIQDACLAAVVVSETPGDGYVLVIPVETATAEIKTFATFTTAATFSDVAADPDAAAMVEDWTPSYLERLEAELGEEIPEDQREDWTRQHTGPEAPFDADDFFGIDNSFVWRPDPRQSTAAWLGDNHPDIFENYAVVDDGQWGLMELDPVGVIPTASRDRLITELQTLGYEVITSVDLDMAYQTASLQGLTNEGAD